MGMIWLPSAESNHLCGCGAPRSPHWSAQWLKRQLLCRARAWSQKHQLQIVITVLRAFLSSSKCCGMRVTERRQLKTTMSPFAEL